MSLNKFANSEVELRRKQLRFADGKFVNSPVAVVTSSVGGFEGSGGVRASSPSAAV